MRLFIALLLPLVGAWRAQDSKITLKFQPRAGDKISEAQKMTMKVDLTVIAAGQKVNVATEQRSSEKKTSQILEVAGDKITRASFHIEEDIEEKKDPGATEFARTQNPLHGRKVTVQSKDGKLIYEGADGIDDKVKKKRLSLEDEFSKSFPPKPVAVGDSWDVTGEALRAIFEDDKMDGKMTLKLAEVKEVDGRKCAILGTVLELKGTVEEKIQMTMSLKGTVVVWIDRGYCQKVSLAGTMTMNGKTEEAEMSGKGPVTIEITAKVQ